MNAALSPLGISASAASVPLPFLRKAKALGSAYLADLYEHVAFLGDIRRRIASLPNGEKVRLLAQIPGRPLTVPVE